jgi:hypothetical protein
MIYFFIQPAETTVKRFKNGRELFSAREPSLVAVSRNRRGTWHGLAAGRDASAVANPQGGGVFLCNPFRTRQLLLQDCDVAVEYVRLMIYKRVLNPFTTLIRPQVIMHLHVEPETPLLPIEKRTLQDIAIRAGAREVFLCELPNMITAQMLAEARPVPQQMIASAGPQSQVG